MALRQLCFFWDGEGMVNESLIKPFLEGFIEEDIMSVFKKIDVLLTAFEHKIEVWAKKLF